MNNYTDTFVDLAIHCKTQKERWEKFLRHKKMNVSSRSCHSATKLQAFIDIWSARELACTKAAEAKTI